jgi:AcrR family transcriptional regulator
VSPQQSARTKRTQDAIAESARSILQNGPTKNLSMVSLASTSGIARATVYNHIGEKADIYRLISDSYIQDITKIISKNPSLVEGLVAIAEFVALDNAICGLRKHDPKALINAITYVHSMPDQFAKVVMDTLLAWNVSADLVSADVVIRWLTSYAINPGSKVDRQVGAEVLANALMKDARP